MFTNKDLKNMIVPLFLEQLLVMLVGVADGIIVSYAGEQAVSVASTVLGRLVFSLIFALVFDMGVIGIAFAMCLDWCLRAVTFIFRVKSGKWKTMKVIK